MPFVRGPTGRSAGEEVGLEREDDVGLVEVIDRVEHFAKSELRSGLGRIPGHRLVPVPLRLGDNRQQFLDLTGQARRADRLAQDPQARPLLGAKPGHLVGDRGQEVVIGEVDVRLAFTRLHHRLRTVGIVQVERSGLREDVGRAEARGVFRIPLDLGRPAGVALDQQSRGESAEDHRRGVELRAARDDILGRLDPGGDLFGRPDGATRHTRQGERRAHQLQEVASALGIGHLRRVLGELAMEEVLERRCSGQLLEASPVFRSARRGELGADLDQIFRGDLARFAHRWQIEQLSSRPSSILYFSTSFLPRSARSEAP